MEIIQIVGISLVAAVMVVLLKEDRPEIALQISIVVGAIVFLLMLNKVASALNVLQDMARRANIDFIYLNTILKIIGIAYIAEFGAQICRDSGSSSIASKIEFAAKIIIMLLSVPILMAVLELLLKILP
ncbi:stage III sporulation protein AD [Thermosediminibacter litoriperuensis]|uniref:Stage III sporulation protein AD n=1 Tax=Thermosediminibacter litoriperuensis TaxID=291989 RepID=A0A5S5AKD8_9FIRM|nr:stage III sporulation protein AD [Thermosediminibacter litoriperuensis]TYP51631.1 stage III sporulation protein AD [Thermosediminibacter litoriperuensis]